MQCSNPPHAHVCRRAHLRMRAHAYSPAPARSQTRAHVCVRAQKHLREDSSARAIAQVRAQAWRCRRAPARAQPIERVRGNCLQHTSIATSVSSMLEQSRTNLYPLGRLAMIKCSICSYQCDNFNVSSWRLARQIIFRGGALGLAQGPSSVAPALHVAGGSTPCGVIAEQLNKTGTKLNCLIRCPTPSENKRLISPTHTFSTNCSFFFQNSLHGKREIKRLHDSMLPFPPAENKAFFIPPLPLNKIGNQGGKKWNAYMSPYPPFPPSVQA